jgi:hypothetical protein
MQRDRTSALRRQPRLGGCVGRADRLIAGRPSRRRRLRRGAGGYGTSSSIGQVVLRERDANTAWHLSSDGTLEERLYYCQNRRHDVVALVTANGELRERVRYSSYGIPFGQPLGDCDGDVDVDAADTAILLGAWGTSTPKCDLGLNGTIDRQNVAVQVASDPGCLTLFGRNGEDHRLLAEHLTAEYKVRTQGRGREVDEWRLRADGLDKHWLDCLVGAAVGASIEGVVLTSGHAPKRKRERVSMAEMQRRALEKRASH